MQFIDADFSPYCARVRIWRNLKGVAIEMAPPPGGSLRSAQFQARVNTGRIPALLFDDGEHLAESQAILQYLEATHPEPRLAPIDALAHAQMQSLMLQVDLYLGPAFFPMFAQLRSGADANNPIAGLLEKAALVLQKLERSACAAGPFISGSAPNLADCCLAPTLLYFHMLPKLFGHQGSLSEVPKLAALWQVYLQHPAFAAEIRAMESGFRTFLQAMNVDPAKLDV